MATNKLPHIILRPETPADYEAISNLHLLAFGQPQEGRLVEYFRDSPLFDPDLSIVATLDGKVVGHILFAPATVQNGEEIHVVASLAPMAVDPAYQRQGIGSQMVRYGLEQCRKNGYKACIVLGHPEYYPRFGFKPASEWDIRPPVDEVPDEAFMAVELEENALEDISGIVIWPEEYNEAL